MPESQSVLTTNQRNKFQQLHLDLTALEKQVKNALKEQSQTARDCDLSPSSSMQVGDVLARDLGR